MKKLILSLFFLSVIGLINPLKAQVSDGQEALKKHINSVVEKVEKAKSPEKKREILNESLADMVTAIDRVSEKSTVSDSDKKSLAEFKKVLNERKDELNGTNGFTRITNSQLNQYANFVQQDIEQADPVLTVSLTTVLLIVLILLLL
jgi:septal ring factor EnvC (AmiA/AmiB activator)